MTERTIDVIGVGSPIVDRVVEISNNTLLSVPGQKGGMELVDSGTMHTLLEIAGGHPTRVPGGSAGNTTFALARMGMACSFLGKLGNDENGDYYREAFRLMGGDCSRFKTDGTAATASCLSLVTPDSERTMRTDLGAAMTLTPGEVTVADFEGCRHAHIEGYLLFNRGLFLSVVAAAREAGCTVSLDLGSFEVVNAARDILHDVLENSVDIVFANEEEAESFSGLDSPEAGLDVLADLCGVAAVKVGAEGAFIASGSERVHVPAIELDYLIDTTGAGDYWAAGFLCGHLRGRPVTVCGRMGALLGGNVCRFLGGSLPDNTWDDIMLAIGGFQD